MLKNLLRTLDYVQQFHKLIVLGEHHENNFKVHKTQHNKRSDFLQNDKSSLFTALELV